MEIRANAKINASLNVVSRREDGYHELEMIMLPLSLCDDIQIEISHEDEYSWNLDMPIDEKNTVVKAVKLMREVFGFRHFYKIHIHKRIPMEAGLGGGTSDAAAVMKAIYQLEGLDITIEELALLGKRIGADVPFGIINQPAIVRGIGEKISTFNFNSFFKVILVKPRQGVSTKECFSRMNLTTCIHPDASMVKQALVEEDFDKLIHVIGNSMEEAACSCTPEISVIKKALIQEGFEGVCMSGSGSTVFALTQEERKIKDFIQNYKDKEWFIEECRVEIPKKMTFK